MFNLFTTCLFFHVKFQQPNLVWRSFPKAHHFLFLFGQTFMSFIFNDGRWSLGTSSGTMSKTSQTTRGVSVFFCVSFRETCGVFLMVKVRGEWKWGKLLVWWSDCDFYWSVVHFEMAVVVEKTFLFLHDVDIHLQRFQVASWCGEDTSRKYMLR